MIYKQTKVVKDIIVTQDVRYRRVYHLKYVMHYWTNTGIQWEGTCDHVWPTL